MGYNIIFVFEFFLYSHNDTNQGWRTLNGKTAQPPKIISFIRNMMTLK